MNSAMRVRLMTRADVPFADSLRALAGWNQTVDDWKCFLALEPDGCFLAEWNGAPVGTATTTVYGPELAWIGMALVHPDFRRRGVGRALLEHCLEYLRGRAVRCIKLDATPLGRTVYHNLGFRDEWTLRRWACANLRLRQGAANPGIRTWRAADAARIGPLDSAAFGVSRHKLLHVLARDSRCAVVAESREGEIAGYGLLRNGAEALYLGPVVAASDYTAISLIETLLARAGGQTIFCDIPDQNAVAGEFAREHGFTAQRSLCRMRLGENVAPGDPLKQFAIAGPERG